MSTVPTPELVRNLEDCALLIPADGNLGALGQQARDDVLQACLVTWFLINDLDDESELSDIFAKIYGAVAASDVPPGNRHGEEEASRLLSDLRDELITELSNYRH